MSKPVTSWSNNDNKPATTWANNDVKPVAAWSNNNIKNTTSFTVRGKNASSWSVNFQGLQSYPYDSAIIPYDSPLFEYDYMVNNNTDNQRLVTTWSDSEL